jgi:quercetin dioxygenase-like cupin family protein
MAFINYNTKNKVDIFPGVHSAMEHSEHITYACVNLDEGTVVPIHHHMHEQWTYVLEGQMEFTLNGEKQLLLPGMGAYIHSNAEHGAVAVTACKVIDVFTPVREDYRKLDTGYKIQDAG